MKAMVPGRGMAQSSMSVLVVEEEPLILDLLEAVFRGVAGGGVQQAALDLRRALEKKTLGVFGVHCKEKRRRRRLVSGVDSRAFCFIL